MIGKCTFRAAVHRVECFSGYVELYQIVIQFEFANEELFMLFVCLDCCLFAWIAVCREWMIDLMVDPGNRRASDKRLLAPPTVIPSPLQYERISPFGHISVSVDHWNRCEEPRCRDSGENNLLGPLPNWLKSLSQLQLLDVSFNSLECFSPLVPIQLAQRHESGFF